MRCAEHCAPQKFSEIDFFKPTTLSTALVVSIGTTICHLSMSVLNGPRSTWIANKNYGPKSTKHDAMHSWFEFHVSVCNERSDAN